MVSVWLHVLDIFYVDLIRKNTIKLLIGILIVYLFFAFNFCVYIVFMLLCLTESLKKLKYTDFEPRSKHKTTMIKTKTKDKKGNTSWVNSTASTLIMASMNCRPPGNGFKPQYLSVSEGCLIHLLPHSPGGLISQVGPTPKINNHNLIDWLIVW